MQPRGNFICRQTSFKQRSNFIERASEGNRCDQAETILRSERNVQSNIYDS